MCVSISKTNRALNSLAKDEHISCYAMLGRIIKRGLFVALRDRETQNTIRDIANETGQRSARLYALERLTERTLFTGCASYVYARDAALKHGQREDDLIDETRAAFERQRTLAECPSNEHDQGEHSTIERPVQR